MTSQACWNITAALWCLTVTSGVWLLHDQMAPVRPGAAIDLWEGVCRADFNGDGERPWSVRAYQVDGDSFVYESDHLHGSDLYRVSTEEVELLLPTISAQIETNAPRDMKSWVLSGHAMWRDDDRDQSAAGLVHSLGEKREQFWAGRDDSVCVYLIEREVLFWNRWRSTRWYWATVFFDWAFLTSWGIFLIWPGLVSGNRWRWCLHLVLSPPLFIAPVYFGYASFSYTSTGPAGGVLYPHLAYALRGGSMSAADIWLYENLPPVLETLSVPVGNPVALTGMGMPGVTGLLGWGVVAGIGWLVLAAGVSRARRWIKQPG